MDTKYVLNEEAAKSYDLAPGAPPVFVDRTLGEIDVRTVKPATIALLIKKNNPHFIEKPVASAIPPAPAAAAVTKPATTPDIAPKP